jgi:hypothetical protein
MTQVFKNLTILTMCLISISSIFGCSAYFGKPIDKVGHHLQKIKDISYKLSVKKSMLHKQLKEYYLKWKI